MTEQLLTVLMPVYNTEKYLREAVDSILTQTYTNFEFLIIDDGSTDSSVAIVQLFRDKRIRFIANKKHQGLVPVLNQGLDLARGKYLARMDADDISLPKRLEKQISYMEAHPAVGICGTWVRTFGAKKSTTMKKSGDPEVVKSELIFGNQLAHPTVMMRTGFVRKNNLYYDARFPHVEDYDFWLRSARFFPLVNIPEILYRHRLNPYQVSYFHQDKQAVVTQELQKRELESLGIKPGKKEILLHYQISVLKFKKTALFLDSVQNWLIKLWRANEIYKIYPSEAFCRALRKRWFSCSISSAELGMIIWWKFWRVPSVLILRSPFKLGLLFLKCFLSSLGVWSPMKRFISL